MDKPNRVAAIIVVAGEGVRMGTPQRKQYLPIGGRPVLGHTLSVFEQCDAIEEILVVIPEGDQDLCQELVITPLGPRKKIHLVSGGPTRQDSVFNGLSATEGRFDLVAIHDGVRPLVRVEQIAECIRVAEKYGACIPAIRARDTIKTVDEEDRVVVTMKRHMIRMAQTPQVFYYNLILGAHLAAQKENYVGTDDAELVELCGEVVKVIPGDPGNIKITLPADLKVAEALLEI
ncbi:MAG: 2-C-methyl-D-erythritol 4-phosphate cytidylyltransferase [Thermodesulfobacteriota bacterium]|nr:2-C-methyl-D-erythritol 4-phosphate cytidylyltransferase [Thermodesulfobacteriota bacterium]